MKGLLNAYSSVISEIILAVILLPVIIKFLSPEQLGFWYVINSILIFSKFVENPLNSAIIRNCNIYINGRTESLNSYLQSIRKEIINRSTISLVTSGSIFFALLSVFFLNEHYDNKEIILSTILFFFGNILALTANLYKCYILLSGNLSASYIFEAYSRSIYTILAIFLILNGSGILGLAFSYLISSAFFILLLKVRVKRLNHSTINSYLNLSTDLKNNILRGIWCDLKKHCISDFSNIIKSRGGVLIIGKMLSLNSAGVYGFSSNLFSLIHRISSFPAIYYQPEYSSLWARNENKILENRFYRNIIMGVTLSIFLSLIIILAGPKLLSFFTDNIQFVPFEILVLFAISTITYVTLDSVIILLFAVKELSPVKKIVLVNFLSLVFQIMLIKNYGIIGSILGPLIPTLLFLPPYLFKTLKSKILIDNVK